MSALRRYEILLPSRFNDGRPVPPDLIEKPLTSALPLPWDFCFLLSQFQLFGPPARALAAEALTLEHTLSELEQVSVLTIDTKPPPAFGECATVQGS